MNWRCAGILSHSRALSADVNAALDPNYGEVFEKANARAWAGVVLTKYTGGRQYAQATRMLK